MNERDRALVFEIKTRLSPELKEQVKRFILFGSRVSGEAAEDSDLDVIVLVDEKTAEIETLLEDIAYQVMWDHDFKPIISLKVFAESQFYKTMNKGFSFYRHVEKEGVTI